jgi:hypothetical protein
MDDAMYDSDRVAFMAKDGFKVIHMNCELDRKITESDMLTELSLMAASSELQ